MMTTFDEAVIEKDTEIELSTTGHHRRDPTRPSILMSPLIGEQHEPDHSPLDPMEENFATIEPHKDIEANA